MCVCGVCDRVCCPCCVLEAPIPGLDGASETQLGASGANPGPLRSRGARPCTHRCRALTAAARPLQTLARGLRRRSRRTPPAYPRSPSAPTAGCSRRRRATALSVASSRAGRRIRYSSGRWRTWRSAPSRARPRPESFVADGLWRAPSRAEPRAPAARGGPRPAGAARALCFRPGPLAAAPFCGAAVSLPTALAAALPFACLSFQQPRAGPRIRICSCGVLLLCSVHTGTCPGCASIRSGERLCTTRQLHAPRACARAAMVRAKR